jgi:hypothetical protein
VQNYRQLLHRCQNHRSFASNKQGKVNERCQLLLQQSSNCFQSQRTTSFGEIQRDDVDGGSLLCHHQRLLPLGQFGEKSVDSQINAAELTVDEANSAGDRVAASQRNSSWRPQTF